MASRLSWKVSEWFFPYLKGEREKKKPTTFCPDLLYATKSRKKEKSTRHAASRSVTPSTRVVLALRASPASSVRLPSASCSAD